ncbi:hypothetical protein JIN84_18050 [Luteolibacter yonseiensis]|uniref:Peptidase S24/S26A/S26B/S26C domain-containing protein n=1 Tax=Luteolibacter yonseiensis TaxID=1144680 RepID=A0A934R5V7_9BACT|nr:S24 family peptidase [Luteolibacter yonseiensis]MBK1817529.1 hypothetical protein [Luteolibacter yonseiensis]
MHPTKEEIKEWLKRESHSREWLGEQCGGTKRRTVDNWLSSPQEIPDGMLTLIARLMADDAAAAAARDKSESTDLERFSVELTTEEFDHINSAASSRQLLVRQWALEVLKEAARRDMEAVSAKEKVMEVPLRMAPSGENVSAFPEVPLFHAAAGEPFSADCDTHIPTRAYGPGRFAVQLHGDSMSPKYPDCSIVVLRERNSLKKPVLKKGEIYLFDINGEKTLKIYASRVAKKKEIEQGHSYVSQADGKTKVRILKALNPAFPEIVVTEELTWLGWLDKTDN